MCKKIGLSSIRVIYAKNKEVITLATAINKKYTTKSKNQATSALEVLASRTTFIAINEPYIANKAVINIKIPAIVPIIFPALNANILNKTAVIKA